MGGFHGCQDKTDLYFLWHGDRLALKTWLMLVVLGCPAPAVAAAVQARQKW